MTYFQFLLWFVLAPILVLLSLTIWDHTKNKPIQGFKNGRAVWLAIAVHVLLAVLYTTPWDNYLVATGVWHYNPALVAGVVLGYVPIEEYAFFVLETLLTGLCWWFLARRLAPVARRFTTRPALRYVSAGLLACLWIISIFLFFSGPQSFTYLSITLFWAFPALLAQLLFGADILWHHRRLVLPAILIPAVYLSLTDVIALRAGTWAISPQQTSGFLFFGILPVEEVVFFLLTNILIGSGLTLLLAAESLDRSREIMRGVRRDRS